MIPGALAGALTASPARPVAAVSQVAQPDRDRSALRWYLATRLQVTHERPVVRYCDNDGGGTLPRPFVDSLVRVWRVARSVTPVTDCAAAGTRTASNIAPVVVVLSVMSSSDTTKVLAYARPTASPRMPTRGREERFAFLFLRLRPQSVGVPLYLTISNWDPADAASDR